MSCPSLVLQSRTNEIGTRNEVKVEVEVAEGESTGLKLRDSLYPTICQTETRRGQ